MLWYKRKNYLMGKASSKVMTGHFRARNRQNMREEVEMVTIEWTEQRWGHFLSSRKQSWQEVSVQNTDPRRSQGKISSKKLEAFRKMGRKKQTQSSKKRKRRQVNVEERSSTWRMLSRDQSLSPSINFKTVVLSPCYWNRRTGTGHNL